MPPKILSKPRARVLALAGTSLVWVALSEPAAITIALAFAARRLRARGNSRGRDRIGPAPARLLLAASIPILLHTALVAWGIPPLARLAGRAPLPCPLLDRSAPLQPANRLTCWLARNYARPEVARALESAAGELRARDPEARLLYLDAGFPFGLLPLLPHLSHDDGRKVDVALDYGLTGPRSPIGYFAYEQPGPGDAEPCRGRWSPLRWDFDWLQPLFPARPLDLRRTRAAIEALLAAPGAEKILLEPHLQRRLGFAGPGGTGDARVRFQGCHAARHDDHAHFQVR